jgi:hypothetical protein
LPILFRKYENSCLSNVSLFFPGIEPESLGLAGIGGILSQEDRNVFLTHVTCFNGQQTQAIQIGLIESKGIKTGLICKNAEGLLELQEFFRGPAHRSPISVRIEFYHPISTLQLGKAERVMLPLQNSTRGQEIFLANLPGGDKSNFYAPDLFLLPCIDLRCRLTLFSSSNCDASSHEFFINLHSASLLKPQELIEIHYVARAIIRTN